MVINGAPSDWVHVISDVPQGSVLYPVFFTIIYINDKDLCLASKNAKFAYDAKLGIDALNKVVEQRL